MKPQRNAAATSLSVSKSLKREVKTRVLRNFILKLILNNPTLTLINLIAARPQQKRHLDEHDDRKKCLVLIYLDSAPGYEWRYDRSRALVDLALRRSAGG